MGIITDFFGVILNIIFEGVAMVTPIGTLGIAIILFTLVTRLLMHPLQLKQQRSTRAMSRIQPEMKRIQKKYENKTDQASKMAYSQELQALYKKHNVSPLAGCLPLLIQFPLIFALYRVLREPSRHIQALGNLYTEIADLIIASIPNYEAVIQGVLDVIPLNATAQAQLGSDASFAEVLSYFTTAQWAELFNQVPEIEVILGSLLTQKENFEWFFVNLVDSPAEIVSSGNYLALFVPIIAGASTFIYSKITMASNQQQQSSGNGEPNPGEGMMKSMNIVMPIMMGFFSYTVPSGLALYWISGNVIMLGQQMWVNKIVDKEQKEIAAKEEKEASNSKQQVTKKGRKSKAQKAKAESVNKSSNNTKKQTKQSSNKNNKVKQQSEGPSKPKPKVGRD